MTLASSPGCGRAHTTREFGSNSECCKCDSGLLATVVPVATGNQSAVAAELVILATPNPFPPPSPGVVFETQTAPDGAGAHAILVTPIMMSLTMVEPVTNSNTSISKALASLEA